MDFQKNDVRQIKMLTNELSQRLADGRKGDKYHAQQVLHSCSTHKEIASGHFMTQAAVLDRIETVACAIEFLVHLIDTDVWSADAALDAACALAELFEHNTVVGYTTIDSHGPVATFETAAYPRLPTWPFSKLRGVPVKRPYVGTCAQAICEGRIIASNISTETSFDPAWRAACKEFGLRSVQSAPVFGFDGRPLATFVTASRRSRHRFDRDMTGFGVYALRTIFEKHPTNALRAPHSRPPS